MAARDAGRSIPSGWGVDASGANATDPKQVKAVLPMAGPKGSGLSLMIEILSSLLVANPIISASLNGAEDAPFNGSVMAIDPRAFGEKEPFLKAVDQLGKDIKGLPPVSEDSDVYLPGERGSQSREPNDCYWRKAVVRQGVPRLC
jgi:ureidoglycolate dehydrogenase (NAD+)